MEEKFGFVRSPVGVYKITADCDGVTEVSSVAEDEHQLDSAPSSPAAGNQAEIHVHDATEWLEQYFKNPRKVSQMKLPKLNTGRFAKKEFHRKVWEVLTEKVGPGSTITYGELAKLAGNPKAARAAGTAMKTNPVPIIVPCHRVITSSGALGNYSSLNGTKTKRWLLDHEKAARH